ncbi:HpcH/HpaI aldolase/citrate lyase family protein [Enterovirga rhinocerotis]|uniref:Beta-methylmalyl-CoA/L-malyl-CoA lyase n=1 Tax=Enterovirga rhinocerotis TaxID=1339210 RepID=A0A4R7C8Q0_9HYPH|nr:CoA ester lyase [Enterovirga rhinocerotis]TDR93236.1 beta-methylmalyl-CoA/L-malyl-CoA lyase [Enterovirga rhinocerotis]
MTRPYGFDRGRLQRSELAVPATSERFFAKAAAGPADALFLDLEDAVAIERKDEARAMAVEAINGLDWGTKTLAVRVNGLDTPWGYKDIIALAESCPRLDLILLPKTGRAEDVYVVETLLSAIEQTTKRPHPMGIECLIETAAGLANVEAIAAASPSRLEALIFGVADFALSIGARDALTGAPNPLYQVLSTPDAGAERVRHWNDPFHFALARIATACRANGIRAIDGPFTNFGDPEGYIASAERAAALGFEGKWAIHPTQIDLANRVFSPQPEELAWAELVVTRMEEAKGRGAIAIDGKLIDIAHLKRARVVLEQRDRIAAAG